jgi:hypothetical protein
MKLFARISMMVLIFWLLGLAPLFAQSTGTTTTWSTTPTLTQLLDTAKNLAISNLDTTTAQFRTQNFSWSTNLETNPNYQSLVCLGILEQVQPSKAFNDAVAALRNEILQNYLELDSRIKSIGLGLPVDQTKLQADITNFASNYATRVTQLIGNYTTQLQSLNADVTAYSAANAALLANLHAKVVQLNSISQQYASLEDLIFQFNNLLLAQEGNVLDAIGDQKRQAQTLLDQRLQALIDQQVGRSTNMIGLAPLLQSRKRDVVRLYGLDFDDAMGEVVGTRYSRQAHDTLREQMQTIRQTFYTNDTLRCQNILTSQMDVDGYARVVAASIADMNRRLAVWVTALQATGSAEQIKQSLFRTFQSLYTTRIEAEVSAMRRYAADQLAILMDRAARQTAQLESLQAEKARHDASRNDVEKTQIRESIIIQGRSLYDAAATQSIRTQVKNLVATFGVDLTPPPQNAQWNTVETTNPFFPVVTRMAGRYSSPTAFATLMQAAIPVLQQRVDAAAPAQKILLQQIIEAIQLYIAQ